MEDKKRVSFLDSNSGDYSPRGPYSGGIVDLSASSPARSAEGVESSDGDDPIVMSPSPLRAIPRSRPAVVARSPAVSGRMESESGSGRTSPVPSAHSAESSESAFTASVSRELSSKYSQFASATRHLEAEIRAGEQREVKLKDRLVTVTAQLAALKTFQQKHRDSLATISQQDNTIKKLTREREALVVRVDQLSARAQSSDEEKAKLAALVKDNELLREQLAGLLCKDLNGRSLEELQSLHGVYADGLLRITTAMSQSLARERKASMEKRQCKICFDHDVDCLLLPCSHFVSCMICARSMDNCPICRRHVDDRRQVYT